MDRRCEYAGAGCRLIPDDGAVAQLGERFNGIEEVRGSNPLSSTKRCVAGLTGIGRMSQDEKRVTRLSWSPAYPC